MTLIVAKPARLCLSMLAIGMISSCTAAFAQQQQQKPGRSAVKSIRVVPGVAISTDLCPIEKMTATTQDKRKIRAFYRKPPGDGPFPAVICIHGGIGFVAEKNLKGALLRNVIYTRFLAAGFVTVAANYRNYRATPKARGPILDCLAIVEDVKKLTEVDPKSVAVYGGSGGGSIALELAGLTPLTAVICGEPATMLFCGMLENGEFDKREEVWANPHKYYTAERKKLTRNKIKKITCPILILHSDQHALKKLNKEILVPELKAAGVKFEYKEYPGNPHGFYWGVRTTKKTVDTFMADVQSFLKSRLKTKAKPFRY